MPRTKPAQSFVCPWCGRMVKSSRSGFVASHLTAGGLKCYAVGMRTEQARILRDAINLASKLKRRDGPRDLMNRSTKK